MTFSNVKRLTWKEARDPFKKVNPELAAIIDQLSLDDDYAIYHVAYPYGSVIVDKGHFCLPSDDGKMLRVTSDMVPEKIREDFNYSAGGLPSGMMLNRSIETFVDSGMSLNPWWHSTGDLFALWSKLDETKESYHPIHIFTVTAGARFLFMTPNIGDVYQHNFLKRDFGVSSPAPKTLLDQWPIFREIISSPQLNCDWRSELLFFSGKWLEKIKDYSDPAWHAFRLYLFRAAWEKTAYWRNKMLFDYTFSCIQAIRNLRPDPYIADTVKYLMAIGAGAVTGFSVAVDNNSAPITLLQQAYLESYRLEKYIPTILCPAYFCLTNPDRSVYYSLTCPTTIEFSPRSRKLSNTIHEMREMKHIFNVYREEILNDRVSIKNTVIGTFVKRAQVEFYHSKEDSYGEIELTSKMPLLDQRLLYSPDKNEERKFADKSAFFRGCVQVSLKKHASDK